MSEAILKFTLPEEIEEFNAARTGGMAHAALSEISQEIFRPARKHGYSDEDISNLIKKINKKCGEGVAEELISNLESKFHDILDNRGLLE